MKELSIISQQKINGGGAIVYVISLVAVAAGYSVAKLLRKTFFNYTLIEHIYKLLTYTRFGGAR